MTLNPQASEFTLSPSAAAFVPGVPLLASCAPAPAPGADESRLDGAAAPPAPPRGAWGRTGPSAAEKLRREKELQEEEERRKAFDGLMAREAAKNLVSTPTVALYSQHARALTLPAFLPGERKARGVGEAGARRAVRGRDRGKHRNAQNRVGVGRGVLALRPPARTGVAIGAARQREQRAVRVGARRVRKKSHAHRVAASTF